MRMKETLLRIVKLISAINKLCSQDQRVRQCPVLVSHDSHGAGLNVTINCLNDGPNPCHDWEMILTCGSLVRMLQESLTLLFIIILQVCLRFCQAHIRQIPTPNSYSLLQYFKSDLFFLPPPLKVSVSIQFHYPDFRKILSLTF